MKSAHDHFSRFGEPNQFAAILREKAGLSVAYASELANARRRPSLKVAANIEDKLGIPASAWMRRPIREKAA